MRFGSVCSGIEAASMAWSVLGWEAAFFSEIEKFPSAVLGHHYPHVPNHGDMRKFQEWPEHAIELLVGGTPCQSFSVAGLRAGLADPRGNLMLTYLAIAARYRPRWLVWENVPGVLSSNDGRDFGTFLRGLAELGYGFAYRVLDAQFCRAHGYEWAVPQRRRRVFVVGYIGDWRRAAAVLFDAASLRGDSPPRREAGQRVAGTVNAGAHPGGYGQDAYNDLLIAHALRADGFDASEDGTGRGTPIVPVVAASLTRGAESGGKGGYAGRRQEDDTNLVAQPIPIDMRQASRGATMTNNRAEGSSGGAPGTGIGEPGDPSPTIASSHVPAIAFPERLSGTQMVSRDEGVSHTLSAINPTAVAIQAGALRENPLSGPDGAGVQEGIAYTLEARAEVQAVQTDWAVRRLTPVECARLQGFPDDYLSSVTYRGKPPADGPMYKALGNSMAVSVMRAIGARIAMIDALNERIAA